MKQVLALITIDCLRYDVFSNSMLIEFRKMQDAVIFHKCYAAGPFTWASFPTIFSSTYPLMLSYGNLRRRFSFIESLAKHGYVNFAFPNNAWLSSFRQYNKGFHYFYEDIAFQSISKSKLISLISHVEPLKVLLYNFSSFTIKKPYMQHKDLISATLKVLNKLKHHEKAFFWIHFSDLHAPYISNNYVLESLFEGYSELGILPEKLARLLAIRLKKIHNIIARQIAILIRTLIEEVSTISSRYLIIITADHGEELYDHKAFGHDGKRVNNVNIRHMYNELLHVPLIVIGSEISHYEDYKTLVHHVDIAPTFIAVSNIESKMPCLGKALTEIIECRGAERSYVISEAKAIRIANSFLEYGETYALIKDDFKYIWHPVLGDELYDLHKDPHEKHNLSSERPDLLYIFKESLMRYKKMINRVELIYKIRRARELLH